jgi:capsule polysaccharide export protein KpsE/RkpR
MNDTTQTSSNPASTPASPQEIAAVITELEEYRDRLIADSTETAKKAKLTKSALMAQIEPELQKIDTALTQLRAQLQN